jgi:hypothetical protein
LAEQVAAAAARQLAESSALVVLREPVVRPERSERVGWRALEAPQSELAAMSDLVAMAVRVALSQLAGRLATAARQAAA